MSMKQGDTVYTEGGYAWEYIATLGDGGIVLRAIIDTDEEDYRYSRSTMVVDKVWSKPPRQLVDAEMAERQVKIDKMRSENNELARQRRALDREIPERIAALAELDAAVTRIEDFMHDRITHVVLLSAHGQPKIATLDKAIEANDYHKERKLVSLFGGSKGSLSWKINLYSDGSGSWREMVPCTSEAEAKELLVAEILRGLASDQAYARSNAVSTADEHGVAVPDNVRVEVMTARRLALDKNVAKKQLELAQAEDKLHTHDGRARDLGSPA